MITTFAVMVLFNRKFMYANNLVLFILFLFQESVHIIAIIPVVLEHLRKVVN